MNNNRLNELLTNPSPATREDYQNIKQLANRYPYAQFLKILQAKMAQVIKDEDQVKMLHVAALYSADRTVLKALYTKNNFKYVFPLKDLIIHEQTAVFPEIAENNESDTEENTGANTEKNTGEPSTENKNLAFDVLKNLEKFRDLREKYDHLLHEETEDNREEQNTTAIEPPVAEPSKKHEVTSDKTSDENEAKHDEIRHIHQPEYQRRLIDNFMSNLETQHERPLPSVKDEQSNKDLSGESTSFDDDIVTETLAKLYVKQGKIEKAIDIYRKLIWKFPQKKAYFAARIEELTNS